MNTNMPRRPGGFASSITDLDQLRELYRPPGSGAVDKETTVLDQGCRDFIAAATMVLVGTADGDGRQDVSPRGGPAGFVKVLDEHRLVIPDLNGNNRLDSIENLLVSPGIGLLFVIPGLGETLRLNGRGCVTCDDAILDLFVDELRRPVSAIGVEIDHAYIHCAKAFRRAGFWSPDSWPAVSGRPSAGQILVDHAGAGDVITGAELEVVLEESYVADLAADLPEHR